MTLNKLTKEFEEILRPLFYGNKSLENIIVELEPYMYDERNIELYKKQFYKSIHNFIHTSGYFIAMCWWNDLKNNKYNNNSEMYEEYIILLKNYVRIDFLKRSQNFYKNLT
jgi:hypothetical protein